MQQKGYLERAWRDRIKREKSFLKALLVKKLLSFDFWISRHFVAIFRIKSAFQNAVSLKAIELFKKRFWFYPVMLFQNYLFVKSLVEILILV